MACKLPHPLQIISYFKFFIYKFCYAHRYNLYLVHIKDYIFKNTKVTNNLERKEDTKFLYYDYYDFIFIGRGLIPPISAFPVLIRA